MLFALLGLAACGAGEPTRFYLLSPGAAGRSAGAGGPIVFVDQATIAPYLDRAQIVSRVSPDQVAFADTRTWAEPVTSMITRYVVDELGSRFGRDRVLETPARRDLTPDFASPSTCSASMAIRPAPWCSTPAGPCWRA